MAERRHALSRAALWPLVALLAACGSVPVGDDAPGEVAVPRPDGAPGSVMRPASASLLEQSRAERRDGNLAQAAATLERAIRIDPAEAAVWLELARLRYAERNWPQAEQLARKARSLSAAGSPVRGAALTVIADALRMQGRPQEAQELEQRFD